ncbi:hypothetical protein HKX48_006956 [Thoreauomyces humboldtii]|nr:hypothetical protein HKX48_006956 [Thoreauomyces humboldtii]
MLKLADPETHLQDFIDTALRIFDTNWSRVTKKAVVMEAIQRLEALTYDRPLRADILPGTPPGTPWHLGGHSLGSVGVAFSDNKWPQIAILLGLSTVPALYRDLRHLTVLNPDPVQRVAAIQGQRNLCRRSQPPALPTVAHIPVAGDDLRVDFTIQRTLYAMQQIVNHDDNCAKWSLEKVQPLQPFVIPLSPSSGLVEWVTARTLHAAMSLVDGFQGADQAAGAAFNYHMGTARATELCTRYRTLLALPEGQSRTLFKSLVLKVPYLRTFWEQQGPVFGPSALETFGKVLMLAICLWIMGIGDRHNENWLVTPDGDAIAIDFDLYLSQGAKSIVPEVAPIRFTPQIATSIPYVDIDDLMTDVLQAQRNMPNVIQDALEILYWQPSKDTVRMPSVFVAGSADADAAAARAEVRGRLRQVTRILVDGVPAQEIIVDGLDKYHRTDAVRPPWLTALRQQVLDGATRDRTNMPSSNLTARRQVHSILDLASDESLLIKLWQGWKPWL